MLSPFNRFFGIGDKSSDELVQTDEIIQLPVDQIIPNRFQPREIFNEEKINELSQTIRTHGIIQPIVVRKLDEQDEYELIAGERRWRAVKQLKWDHIPAIIRNLNNTQTASIALIENLQREELTVVEEANAYQQLIDMHDLTQEALAQRLGKSQSTIANKLRLLRLPAAVQQALLDQEITERHARALIKVKEEKIQLELLDTIIEHDLNVRETEEKIEKMNEPEKKEKRKRPVLKGFNKDIRIALNTIRQSLDMVSDTGIDVKTEEKDHESYYEFTIKIPKD